VTEYDRNQGEPSQTATRRQPSISGRTAIFVYDVVVLAIVLAVGVALIKSDFQKFVGNYRLLVLSMWFGALGGLMISFKGIYDHAKGQDAWDDSFSLWHIGRPLSGAIAGLMTVVILQAVNPGANLTHPVVYVSAFIFGTQERRFFNFLYEVARLVVQVPDEGKVTGLRITEIQPTEGSAGTVILIKGQGIEASATVKLGTALIEKLIVASDGSSVAGVVPTRPLGADNVDVIIVNPGGASSVLPAKFKYTS
jgi:hypothetical protein